MRISKKTRDEAILICAIAASAGKPVPHSEIRPHLGVALRDSSSVLALDAWSECADLELPDAEAAQLLRDGWSPGDPVETL